MSQDQTNNQTVNVYTDNPDTSTQRSQTSNSPDDDSDGPEIKHTPYVCKSDLEIDDVALNDECVRTFDGMGQMRVTISWPQEIEREWIDVEAGEGISLVFQDENPNVKFHDNLNRFRIDEYANSAGFDLKIHPDTGFQSRTIEFCGVSSGDVYSRIKLKEAS